MTISKLDRRQFLLASGALSIAPVTVPSPMAASTWASSQFIRVLDLNVDYLVQPLGLENPRPTLSWRIESETRNTRQSKYRILVASNEASLQSGNADLWDSGEVASSENLAIPYAGHELASRQRCWWCVHVWTEADAPPAKSTTSWWEMGLLEPRDWLSQWLAVEDEEARADREFGLRWIWSGASLERGSQNFRFSFDLPSPARRGDLVAVINDWHWWLQLGGIWIDGKPIAGPAGWVSQADRLEPHQVHRLSRVELPLGGLSAGRHVIAVSINAGKFWGGSQELLQRPAQAFALFSKLTLEDDATIRVGSGSGWKTCRQCTDQWQDVDYDDGSWSDAVAVPLMDNQPWPAQPAMHLRRTFVIDRKIVKARLYATALGAYEARLNGQRVGDALLAPEPTQYSKRVLYRAYDVTGLVRAGPNVLGLTVGDGWYAGFDGRYAWAPPPRRVLAQLEVFFSDGSREVIATGPGWRTSQSPILSSQIRSGEIYDARLEQPGWDADGFDDGKWRIAQTADAPPCRLVSQTNPPIRLMQILKPVEISRSKSGATLVDFGQNFSGACELGVTGRRGTRIELRYGEKLTASGDLDHTASHDVGEPPKMDIFILRGDPAGEKFSPRFCYRGLRYVEINGLETELAADSIAGLFIHTDMRVIGRIKSSSALIETISNNILQTQKSNFVGIATDNATREFRGWLGDAGVFWDTAAFYMDVRAFTSRFMDNLVDDQGADGDFPIFAPMVRHNSSFFSRQRTSPAWGDAGIIVPWVSWRHYGDVALIHRHWTAMDRYISYIARNNPDFLWKSQRGFDFGDWLALKENGDADRGGLISLLTSMAALQPVTPLDLVATAYWAHSADLLSQMSRAIGRIADAERLATLFENICKAFNRAFVADDGRVGNGSQASYVLAVAFRLLPEQRRAGAVKRLAEDIRKRGTMLTTGILGTQFVLDVLANGGEAELAYDLLLRTDYPSWGYMIRHGATTIWERWDGQRAQNQGALGAIGSFLYRRLAGIEAAEAGFRKIVIHPRLSSRVTRGGGEYESAMGRIATAWSQGPVGNFVLDVTIPANASAHIHLPAQSSSRIFESGRELPRRDNVRLLRRGKEESIVAVGSGSYRFTVVNGVS